jgi:hypothetical protein
MRASLYMKENIRYTKEISRKRITLVLESLRIPKTAPVAKSTRIAS